MAETLSPGKQLSAMREIVDGTCARCGTAFRGIRKRRYCSDRCRFADITDARRTARRESAS